MIERMRAFILERFAEPPPLVSLREADQYGHTWEEYERLKLRGSPQFVAVRAGLRIGGRLSKGIDLGWRKRFRFGAFARLRLRKSAAGFVAAWAVHRCDISQQHRLARHSAAQSESRKGALRSDQNTSCGRPASPNSRHRGRCGALRARDNARRCRAFQSARFCATTDEENVDRGSSFGRRAWRN